MWRSLHGKRILVTGASRGIGRCLAESLAEYGARLALTARSVPELTALAKMLRAKGVEVHPIPADLTDPVDRQRLIEEAVRCMGGLDVLINNAGLCSFGEFSTSDETILRRIMEINFFAPIELIRLALPFLAESGNQAAVVNVASICGRTGIPSFPEHCASKFALVGLTEALRAELIRFDVDVLLVIPGLARADDLDRHLLRNEGKIYLNWANAQRPERVARAIVRALRWGWRETVSGWIALQVHRLQRFMPWLLNRIMIRKVLRYQQREQARPKPGRQQLPEVPSGDL